jgi:signal transduction histidine kinase
MSTILQQIINILIVPPGNLIYHLVLAFSVAGALQIAANSTSHPAEHATRRRMLLGLLLLLVLRLGLFVAAGAGWQGLVNERQLLPPLDRLSTLLGLVVLLWLWVFPRPTRLGDASTALLGLLGFTGSLLALVWWNGQGLQESFNNSWTAFGLDIFALALAALGILLLALRRPTGWEWGLAMCTLLAAGHALQLYTGDLQSDYPALVRLAQLTAFPLLLLLPGRLAGDRSTPGEMEPAAALKQAAAAEAQSAAITPAQRLVSDRRDPLAAAELLQAALELGIESEPEKAHQAITRAVSHAFLADICLLLTPPGAHGSMTLLAGYDLIRACSIAPARLTSSTIPVIASSLRRGRSVRLPFNSASPDLTGLAELLEIDQSGNVAAVPVFAPDKSLAAGLILLAPYSGKVFQEEDLRRMEDAARPVAQLLQHSSTTTNLQAELEQTRQQLDQQRGEAGRTRQELQALQALLQELSGKPDAEETINDLRAEVEQLRSLLSAAPQEALPHNGKRSGETEAARAEASGAQQLLRPGAYLQANLEGELRLALEEVAQLTLALQTADQRIQELKAQPRAAPESTATYNQQVTGIAQELRQPMSSIIGYTDFLLGETVGILGALQRRFLERVRLSTLRMARLVDELVAVASQAGLPGGEQASRISLEQILDETLLATSNQLRQKDITMRVDLPEQAPLLQTDPAALQQVLERLLENASLVTPSQGQIALRVCLHSDGSQQEYALLQVSDQGGGISHLDLPRLFVTEMTSEGDLAKQGAISGVGLPLAELARLKLLAEVLGGRLWVESEPGAGATYSLLVPTGAQPMGAQPTTSQLPAESTAPRQEQA